jgi:hypothetical protein
MVKVIARVLIRPYAQFKRLGFWLTATHTVSGSENDDGNVNGAQWTPMQCAK